MPEAEPRTPNHLDFNNTDIAFNHKSNRELKATYRLFSLMKSNFLVSIGSKLGLLALKLRLPFVKTIIRKTIFRQFVGGENLMDCQEVIDHLYKNNTLTILDYGAEAKSLEKELDEVLKETIRAIELGASNSSVPCVSTKITGLGDNVLLEKLNSGTPLNEEEKIWKERLYTRVDKLCSRAKQLGVTVLIDAEESWMQIAIDDLVELMMEKYNGEKPVVFNTYQLYRHDKLAQLKKDHLRAVDKGYLLGAKLVRGAYMDKERKMAVAKSYESPIHKDKSSVDKDYDASLKYCVENHLTIASICATHNIESNKYQAKLIEENGIDKTHPHLNFCQLYGMSDYITFNLSNSGFNVAKYVPYGPIDDVVPYLIRRAKENTSVTGEMGREMQFIKKEMSRRAL